MSKYLNWRSAIVLAGAAIAISIALRTPKPPPGVEALGPGVGDPYAKLIRASLTAKDPLRAESEAACEFERLLDAYGPEVAFQISEYVEDTVYKFWDLPARRRLNGALAGQIRDTKCPPG
jgi:hypothetical protein